MKFTYLYTLIILLWWRSFIVYGQEIKLKGKVADKISQEPVAYCAIELIGKRKGIITNEKGEFEFIINYKNLYDTLVVSALGYDKYIISQQEKTSSSSILIFLNKRIFQLGEINITAKNPKRMVLGYKNEKKAGNEWMVWGMEDTVPSNYQCARFIKNTGHHIGYIKNVQFFISRPPFVKGQQTPFRVRIYKADGDSAFSVINNRIIQCNSPGTDLLNKSLIVSAQHGGWFKVDVSQYKIPIPEEGFFVAMEWIYTDEKWVSIEKTYDSIRHWKFKSYGPDLRISRGNNDDNFWMNFFEGNNFVWITNILFPESFLYENAMIRTEVEIYQ